MCREFSVRVESKYFLEKLVVSPQYLRLVAPRSRLQARRLEIARPSLPGEAERVSERRALTIHAGRPLSAEQRPLPRGRLLQRAVPLRGHHRQRFDLRRRAERHADRRFGALSADRRGSQREIVRQTAPRIAGSVHLLGVTTVETWKPCEVDHAAGLGGTRRGGKPAGRRSRFARQPGFPPLRAARRGNCRRTGPSRPSRGELSGL